MRIELATKPNATSPMSKAKAEQSHRMKMQKIVGTSFLAGAAQYHKSPLIAQSLNPAYNIREQAVSELGVGSVALFWNTSLLLLGVMVIIGGYFAYHSLGRRLTAMLAFILGVGSMGAGLFPLDSPTGLHGLFALFAFAGGGLFALTSYRVVASKWMKLFSIFFGLYSLSALTLHASETNLGLGGGGMERMIIFPLVIWLIAFSGYLLNTGRSESVS